jgi:hypothetical protein
MPEPIIQRLSQFTPDGSRLDRDALLFAAGRASVRPNRGWMAAAGALAACQLATLVFLWPRPPAPDTHIVANGGPPTVTMPTGPSDASQMEMLNRRVLASKDADLPPDSPSDDLVPAAPPLHAFAAPTPSWLD